MMLQGSMTALATPFTLDGLDQDCFERFVAWQVEAGAEGLVPCGVTGEAPTLSAGERHRLIRACVECASGAVPVLAGTGTNCTATTIDHTRAARAAGADAALIVTPYYNKPSQEGLFRHFEAVASAVDIPIVVHNVPKRTGVDLHFSTVARLAEIPNVVGIVDASGDVDRPRVTALVAGSGFVQLCGDDTAAVTFDLAGGRGCVSVASNVVPSLCRDLQRACGSKDWARARVLQSRIHPLLDALRRDISPGPVKYALSLLRSGFAPATRLPLVGVAPDTAAEIQQALVDLGLLESPASFPARDARPAPPSQV